MQRTFSSPKNLSVPSFRTGPAFCSIFSNGVISTGGSSFFAFTAGSFVAVEAPYNAQLAISLHQNLSAPKAPGAGEDDCCDAKQEPGRGRRTRLTVLALRSFFMNPDIVRS